MAVRRGFLQCADLPPDGAPSIVLGLRMLMITAWQTRGVRGARWVELDRKEALWTIPAERMTMREEHRVPLSKQALEVLDKIESTFVPHRL